MSDGEREVVLECLESAGVRHARIRVGDDAEVVVTEYGGRILGPFFAEAAGDGGRGAFWLNDGAFAGTEAFARFVAGREWNLGGERVWVSPEIRFHVRDRTDFWGSLDLPPEIDPGSHHLETDSSGSEPAGTARITRAVNVRDHFTGEMLNDLRIERSVAAAANPLRHSGAAHLSGGAIAYAGYRHTVRFRCPAESEMPCEPWTLFQVQPGGWAIVAAAGGQAYRDYFEAVPADQVRRSEGCIAFRVGGTHRFKVGVKAANVLGRIGYLERLDNARSQLIVRSFANDPSAEYLEEPPHRPGDSGQSVHVVDDGGTFAGFGELECNGRSIGGETGRTESGDDYLLWCFRGATDSIREIAGELLGTLPDGVS